MQRARHGSESGAATLSWFILPVDLPYIPCLLLSSCKLNGDCPHFLYISLSTSTPQPSMSTPPQESIPDVHPHTMPLATTQTALSSPGQASSLAENPSKPSVPMPVLDAAQTSPPRPTSSSSYHATLISKPVPEVPREYITADASAPAEVLPRVASSTFHVPPTSISAHAVEPDQIRHLENQCASYGRTQH